MSAAAGLARELEMDLKFFKATCSVFEEGDAGYAAKDELYTVAGHVAHVADTVNWFVDGAFGDGWDMDFEALIERAKAVTTLSDANKQLDEAFKRVTNVIANSSDQELFEPIHDKQILGDAPRLAIVSCITDHTAHHRGALSVYARLLGKEPPMPYA